MQRCSVDRPMGNTGVLQLVCVKRLLGLAYPSIAAAALLEKLLGRKPATWDTGK